MADEYSAMPSGGNGSSVTKFLTVVAVLAVLASGIGFFSTLSSLRSAGYASSDEGNVTFEIESKIDISFITNLINWSTGYVNTSGPAPCVAPVDAQLATDPTGLPEDGSSPPGIFCGVNWIPQLQGLTLQSDSNQDINISLSSTEDASTLLDGLGNFMWKFSDNETGTCQGNFDPALIVYTEIIAGSGVILCNQTDWNTGSDALDIDFLVNISDQASVQGEKTAVITATAIRSEVQN